MNFEIIKYTDLENENNNLLSIFSTSKPRDIIVGTCSGVRNISVGLVAGVCSLVAFPLYGTINEGIPGLAKGMGAGIITGIGLPVTGIYLGGIQFLKGILNTPKAFYSIYNGKIWDNENKKWILYNLNKETIELLNKNETDYLSKKKLYEYYYFYNDAIEKEYYRILQLNVNCSQKEIKNSYHKLALKYHPDKNFKNNKEMVKKFLKINEAYQVLNDPESRRLYNKMGKEGIKNCKINNDDFYNLFFETDKFEFYLGELTVVDYINKNINKYPEIQKFKKKKREIKLANNLCQILKVFIEKIDDIEEYYKQITNELMVNVLGNYILKIIGNIYVEISQNYLYFFRSLFNTLKCNYRNIENNITFVSSVIKSHYQVSNEKKEITSSMIDLIFSVIIFDIEETIANICYKILNDFNVSYQERIDRANGLIYLGEIFKNNDTTYEEASNYLKNKLISLG